MSSIIPGAEPFLFPGSQVGCLLIHGFTSTPQEMRRLGEFLGHQGWVVNGMLVAGHGTTEKDLARTTWQDWSRSVDEAMGELASLCERTFVIGQSLGGVLALHAASHFPVSGVVAMATPLVTDLKLLWLARAMKRVRPYRKKGPSNILDPESLAQRVAYHYWPNASNEQIVLLCRHLREDLSEIRCPALLIHSWQDKTVNPKTMPMIYEQLGSTHRTMVWLENSGHVLTEDYERDKVYALVRDFMGAQLAKSGV